MGDVPFWALALRLTVKKSLCDGDRLMLLQQWIL